MTYTINKKILIVFFIVNIFFILFWCSKKISSSTNDWDPRFQCISDSDCVLEETACYNCGCPISVNKFYKKDIQCGKPTATNQCNLACPITQVKCKNNICAKDNL